MIGRFEVSGIPAIVFGEGTSASVPDLAARLGRRALLVTGERSLDGSPRFAAIEAGLGARSIARERLRVAGEPSPRLVDDAVARFHDAGFEVVIGIGGGSALDAAKTIAGLLPTGRSVMDHLEGVGRGVPYAGPAIPLVAVPTTAGTGTEATKNSVLSETGEGGFKRSFRHDLLLARHAVVDPDLLESCPRALIAADGMDALTQLLESYVSIRANPFTDALAESGLAAVRDGLLPWFEGKGDSRSARARMAWAALASGITLAQVGLGSVHGLASALGASFPVPHGVVCGTLVAAATEVNVDVLRERDPSGPALAKYARVSAILGGRESPDGLVALLREWTERLGLPRLGAYGVTEEDAPALAAGSRGGSMKTNPIVLTDEEIGRAVRARV